MDQAAIQQVLGFADRTAWVITSGSGDRGGGLVATFVSNASLVPALPRLVVGLARHHHTCELIDRSRAFAAHLVAERQCELIWRFGIGSGRHLDKLTGLQWRPGPTGSPLLADALGWVDCSVEAELDIGDRSIYVARIVDGGVTGSGTPLTANRIMQLATPEQRQRLDEERRRDEAIDAAAIRAWRAARP